MPWASTPAATCRRTWPRTGEIETVKEPIQAASYTDVYDRYGLLGLARALRPLPASGGRERRRLSETGSVAVFCPTSNLFIGSGLFDLAAAREPRIP